MLKFRSKCGPRTESLGERAKKEEELIDYWFNKSANLKKFAYNATGTPETEALKMFWYTHTGKDFDFGDTLSRTDLKLLEKKMRKADAEITKTPGKFKEYFFLPETVLSKNHITKKTYKDLEVAHNHYRGKSEAYKTDVQTMVRLLNAETVTSNVMGMFNIGRNKAQKRIAEMETEYKKRYEQDGPESAAVYYEENLRDLSKDPGLAQTQALYDVITNPNKVFKNRQSERAAEQQYGTAVVQAARVWKDMSKGLWKELTNGIDSYIKMLEGNKSVLGRESHVIDKLKENLKDLKYEDNYFPTQVLDVFPTLNRLTEDMYSGKINGENAKNISEYVETTIKEIKDNVSVPGHVFERKGESPRRVSKNVLSVIDSYTNNVLRFNFTSRVSESFSKGIRELGSLEGKEMDNHIRFLTNYMRDTHSTALGLHMKNSKLKNFARAITSYEFMSKLGLNVRSWARNATQSVQNYVWFGYKGIREAQNFAKSGEMKRIMDEEMQKHGVFFTNIEELAYSDAMLPNVKVVDGKVIETGPTTGDKIGNAMETFAKKVGKPMQWVENKINRQTTFKIAFAKHYLELSKNPEIVRKYVEGNMPKDLKGKSPGEWVENQVATEIRKRSSRFAADMVKDLHYEYSAWGKPKAFTTTAGSVLGQFSTYGINFLNYQYKIGTNAWDAATSGKVFSPETARLARLGLVYQAIIPAASALFSTDVANLVQHDTKERIAQWQMALGDDPDEKAKAFFGKGPLIGTVGGPFISDLLTAGQLLGFMEMDEDDWKSYLMGYEDFSELTQDDKVEKFVRLLNTQVGRTMFSTTENVINGAGIMGTFQSEVGLYKTPEQKEAHSNMLATIRKFAPERWHSFLTPDKEERKKERAVRRAMKGPSSRSRYRKGDMSPGDLESLMAALNRM